MTEAKTKSKIDVVIVVPLHGLTQMFSTVEEATLYVSSYPTESPYIDRDLPFVHFHLEVRYLSAESFTGTFTTKQRTIEFLDLMNRWDAESS